ncbi:MAG TPA: hypothetical protein VE933_06585 [Chitinophagaceae bacterium]|nr:hypothetical protein [Chitinophagaceae bacterium]
MKKLLVVFSLALFSCNNQDKNNNSERTDSTGKTVSASSDAMESPKARDLRVAMRKLWEDHITWTRNVIFCLADNLPGADQAVKRLLENQDDIGNAIKPYYGDDAGKQLTALLRDHITTAADVVKAAKANNKIALDSANKKWFDNADQISDFLSKANPDSWKLDDVKMMMHDHLKLTTDEAVARIKKDYDADVKAYDKVHDEILEMSDALSKGIVKQFPDKF